MKANCNSEIWKRIFERATKETELLGYVYLFSFRYQRKVYDDGYNQSALLQSVLYKGYLLNDVCELLVCG